MEEDDTELVQDDEFLINSTSMEETPKRGRKVKPKIGDPYTAYSSSDILHFLTLIESREAIWNSRNDDWHRTNVKSSMFAEVEGACSKFMTHNIRSAGKCAKVLWDNLVKEYGIHCQRINKAKSGSGVDDVKSSFPYSAYMQFVSVAKKDRETKIAFCIGSERHTIMETPKRKLEESTAPRIAKHSRKDSLEETLKEEMGKTRDIFAKLVESTVTTNGPTTSSTCQSSRICQVFKSLVEGKDFIETVEFESKVISFMSSLRAVGRSGRPVQHTQLGDSSFVDMENTPPILHNQVDDNYFEYYN